jgi:hypothetical protein
MSRSCSCTGSGRSSTPWISANITVVAAIPTASVNTPAVVNALARHSSRTA